MSNQENITIPEAIGFWQANKKWLWPTILAVLGLLGGANVDKVGGLLPENPNVVERLDNLDSRVSALEGKITPKKKDNPDSSQDGVIIIE